MNSARLPRAVLVGLAFGCLAGCGGTGAAPPAVVPAVVASFDAGADSPSARFGANAAGSSPESARVPVRVRIPSIGVSAPVGPLALGPDGELTPPARPDDAGWYPGSSVPGEVGPAVIAGHVDSLDGPAVFSRLRELRPGAAVQVARSDGTSARFTVVRVERLPKARFPTASVYGPTPDRALRLITCGGAYDRDGIGYLDNVIAYAVADQDAGGAGGR